MRIHELLVVLAQLFFTLAYGQADNALSSFSSTYNDGYVYLIWTMKAGYTCNGISVQRSTDLISFQEIGIIAGVCGADDQEVTFSFTDERPVPNQINHYRLEMGQLGYTSHRSVDVVDFSDSKISIRPNPMQYVAQILIDNPQYQWLEVSLYDARGNLFKHSSGRIDRLDLRPESWPTGVYLLRVLYEDGESVTKTLVIVN